jgi:membrane-associated phospholipid phosphatase
MVSRRTKSFFVRRAPLGIVALGLLASACEQSSTSAPEDLQTATSTLSAPAADHASTYARQWMTNIAFSVKFDRIDPPTAARSYAYAAIAAYEAVVHGMPGNVSLAGQLNGLDSLPQPDPDASYDWPTVLSATLGRVVPATFVFPNTLFFEYTTATNVTLRSMERVQINRRLVQGGVPQSVIDDSTEFGHALGDAIAAWANADGYADMRYAAYEPPTGGANWKATGYVDAQTARPLLPHFGRVRPVAMMSADDCTPAAPPPFETTPGSDMYEEALTVYETDQNLTKEQREIALFWADGGGSETPAGHWVKITNDLIRAENLAVAVRAYVPVAVSMFDSAIATWKAKYDYNLMRPETYIHQNISSQWISLLPAPQFPAYTSGHSGFSMAAAISLESAFGDVAFTDKTKVRGGFKAVAYPSFSAAAEEASVSRLYGGIHFPMDNSEGRALGACAANAFLNRVTLEM